MGDGVAERTTALVPNLDHRRLFSLGWQLSRERGRHPPTGHDRNLRVPNLKFCQNQKHMFTNLQYPPLQTKQTNKQLVVGLSD